ncbi:ornithine decarboxylase [Dongia mobilis]|uniref:ornithine decarboxylase n=1 Tax=Dongia mobilis TaxID=578943 RepID=A0A4R6WWQ2_9PROT|nr:type III PLP-dependent enzyme [Dongia mobilis]TDQ84474.1 ornithine decarboxylase [Dongia mobilis]
MTKIAAASANAPRQRRSRADTTQPVNAPAVSGPAVNSQVRAQLAPQAQVANDPAPRPEGALRFLSEAQPATPCLVVDLGVVARKYAELQAALPRAEIFYAVKANPAPEILGRLAAAGSSFDTASAGEIRAVFASGARPERVSFGNTIKKPADIAWAYGEGVRLFAFDAIEELRKIAAHAPGAEVYCRILVEAEGALWPLNRKFGCVPDMAVELLTEAQALGLKPAGVSFHVGSQQQDPTQWNRAIAAAGSVFRRCADAGVRLSMIDLGGGFPADYAAGIAGIGAYGAAIAAAMNAQFGDAWPRLIIEPGRYMVADAGIIEAEVLLVSRKSAGDDRRWVYLDIGRFGGLAETEGEAIRYRVEALGTVAKATGPVILAGPTCDSADILYDKADYRLPLDLKAGDRVRLYSTGAYTTTYSAVNFNGFDPLRAYFV